MDDVLTRFVTDLFGRVHGPLTFRLILQPAMAILFAVRDGVRSAREGRPPYLWSLFTVPKDERWRLLQEGWKAVMKVFLLAVVLDIVYQVIVFRWVYPFESLTVAVILAFLPYLLLRGVVDRIVSIWVHPQKTTVR